jgi:methionyl-tRNA synthetase
LFPGDRGAKEHVMAKVLITSALPYINGTKHLGNLVGSLLPADVQARFRRQIGDAVLFICATDEHGTPAELAARDAGLDVAAYCERQHAIQADIYRGFALSFDYFGRSSSVENHELTQHFYRCLDANGLIEERLVKQIWSPADQRFLPDRYVLGTCPHCGFAAARGDQCDGCASLLDPVDLIAPRSALSGSSRLERRDSRHLFLRQSLLVERLCHWVDGRSGWPPFVTSLARSLLTADLRDRCITRDLAWGVPVPRAGFDGKVFYVWFDAPIAYIATTKAWAGHEPARRDWKDWWWEADDVTYLQFLGKDNVPFHVVSFPATLIGAQEPWKRVDVIKGFHWLNHAGGKFSTSRRRGIFTDAALAECPADYWRWWLIANAPETSDTEFTFARFAAGVNKDLADTLGNLVNRCLQFTAQHFAATVPAQGTADAPEHTLAEELDRRIATLRGHHATLEFRKAAAETRAIFTLANVYLTEQAPWTAIKTDRARAAAVVRTALNLIRVCAVLSWCIVPNLAAEILRNLGETADLPPWPSLPGLAELDRLPHGRPLGNPGPLAAKISDDDVDRLTLLYAGSAE